MSECPEPDKIARPSEGLLPARIQPVRLSALSGTSCKSSAPRCRALYADICDGTQHLSTLEVRRADVAAVRSTREVNDAPHEAVT